MARAKKRLLLDKDSNPIELVPRRKREFWNQLTQAVGIGVPARHRKKLTEAEIARIICATDETDTYESLTQELARTDGAIRHIKTWAGHILKGEYDEKWGAWVLSTDSEVRRRRHDIILIHKVLKEGGYLDLPITEQFRLAKPLAQPRGGWRGDRTSEAIRRRRSRLTGIRAAVVQIQGNNRE